MNSFPQVRSALNCSAGLGHVFDMTAVDEPVRLPLSKGSTREDCNGPSKNAQDAKAKSLNSLFQLGQSDADDVIIHPPARDLCMLPWVGKQLDAGLCFSFHFQSGQFCLH
jgi:hypothetical protein